jgi:hypothetical protein
MEQTTFDRSDRNSMTEKVASDRTPIGWPRWITPVALLVTVFVINFAAMPALWFPGDPYAWREETRSMLRDGTLHVDAHFAEQSGERGQYFVFNPRNGQWYSKYGVMNSLMALPPMKLEQLLTGRFPREGEFPNLLIFNLYNILLSLVVCALLYRIAGWYTQRPWVRVVYVLSTFYATYFWYYQRAQTSEIVQVLDFTAAFYFLMIYLRASRSSQGQPDEKCRLALLLAWLFVAALLFTRILFGLLIPTIWLAVVYASGALEKEQRRQALWRQIPWLLLPVLLMITALAWINQVKFGSPWLTGYHQWRAADHLPSGRWQDGIWGILFDPQGSMLLHFPILIFSLLGLREFHRRYKLDTVVIFLLPSVLLLVLTKTPMWRGEWSYGPRLVIFMLPVLALPFLLYVEWLAAAPRHRVKWTLIAVTAMGLGYSTYLQFQVNRLEYFTMYQATEPISGAWTREMARYFLEHQMGVFNSDLIRHRDDLDNLSYVANLKARGVSDQRLRQYKDLLRALANQENFYWRRPPAPLSPAPAAP